MYLKESKNIWRKVKVSEGKRNICRKVSFLAGDQKHKYMKESKNISRKTNIGEGKQKYLQESKFICRKAKIFKAQQKLFEGKQKHFRRKAKTKNIRRQQKILKETWHFRAIVIKTPWKCLSSFRFKIITYMYYATYIAPINTGSYKHEQSICTEARW